VKSTIIRGVSIAESRRRRVGASLLELLMKKSQKRTSLTLQPKRRRKIHLTSVSPPLAKKIRRKVKRVL
jgi:hypothetical protein